MPRHIRSGIYFAGAVVLGFAAIKMSTVGTLRMAQETLPGPEREVVTSAAMMERDTPFQTNRFFIPGIQTFPMFVKFPMIRSWLP